MNKTKKSFFKFGILIFSFLLISCDDKLNLVYLPITETPKVEKNKNVLAQANDSPKQQTRVEQKIAEHGYVEAQADDFVSSEQQVDDSPEQQFEVGPEDALEQLLLGMAYANTSDHKKAVYWYKKSAEQGYTMAQYKLGYIYDYGQGVSKDLEKAVYWYKKAAENGDSAAIYRLKEIN